MKPTVVVTLPIPTDIEENLRNHCNVIKWEGKKRIPRTELLKLLEKADGLLTAGGKIDEELLDAAPLLKVVSNISVGYNNLDIEAMKKRGVVSTHTPYVLDDTVADLIIGLMLSCARRIPELDRFVKEGGWRKGKDYDLFGWDVHHTTLGIIGLGRIGEAVAKRAKFGFDMNVLYHNRNRKQEVEEQLDVIYSSLDDLLQQSDFVVLMTPLTDDTYKLIGKKQFELMKDSAFFINASRGATVDEEALIEALQLKQLRGAGLDVFAKEPIEQDNPLLAMDNVVTLPHIGSATAKTRYDMAKVAAEDLLAVLEGRSPRYLVKEFKEE
ncbi:2-hydroxyacid dehydrogenase [Bacillus alkalicellulosilyticus]|uniref:2-hydroxyacid dehydrogenase n=1 Tax=Alkalihalobacterium alkalicellulosilyticum TaxID=1912214 RepID=UPI0009984773|nr:D-glycerate dehydrogenase [Bacillus alkalicellulosilyticus]